MSERPLPSVADRLDNYDADGNPGSVSNSGGGFTQFYYDEAGRVTSTTGSTAATGGPDRA